MDIIDIANLLETKGLTIKEKGEVMLKKIILFMMSFMIAYFVLQLISGFLLTMFFTPDLMGENGTLLQTQVAFGSVHLIPVLVISLTSLGVAFTILQLSKRKLKNH